MVTRFCATNVTYKALTSDTKPANARNGDRLLDMNKGALYIFDEENMKWWEFKGQIDPTSNLVGIAKVGHAKL